MTTVVAGGRRESPGIIPVGKQRLGRAGAQRSDPADLRLPAERHAEAGSGGGGRPRHPGTETENLIGAAWDSSGEAAPPRKSQMGG